ncbi:hypothetical protein CIPAW_02G010100 [Carya illinoinensis]|uniref:Uncharacterized protein n=1 Tax=Carya illinoinensis TaxID=32201 RepID=A0A8T1R9C0_CARIL|nr:hypothetical protein CIPAW_02G010100 [Carya illinoinensis]
MKTLLYRLEWKYVVGERTESNRGPPTPSASICPSKKKIHGNMIACNNALVA